MMWNMKWVRICETVQNYPLAISLLKIKLRNKTKSKLRFMLNLIIITILNNRNIKINIPEIYVKYIS